MAQNTGKEQRVRDPVHGLLVFSRNNEFEQLCWRLLNCREFQRLRRIGARDVLRDRATVTAYKFREYESPDALSKVMIRRADGSGAHEDVARLSTVVSGIGERKLFRLYAKNESVRDELLTLWREVKK